MTTRNQRGMVTAEFTVGTFGTVLIAAILYKLGVLDHNNPWIEAFRNVLERALAWHKLSDFIPGLGLKR